MTGPRPPRGTRIRRLRREFGLEPETLDTQVEDTGLSLRDIGDAAVDPSSEGRGEDLFDAALLGLAGGIDEDAGGGGDFLRNAARSAGIVRGGFRTLRQLRQEKAAPDELSERDLRAALLPEEQARLQAETRATEALATSRLTPETEKDRTLTAEELRLKAFTENPEHFRRYIEASTPPTREGSGAVGPSALERAQLAERQRRADRALRRADAARRQVPTAPRSIAPGVPGVRTPAFISDSTARARVADSLSTRAEELEGERERGADALLFGGGADEADLPYRIGEGAGEALPFTVGTGRPAPEAALSAEQAGAQRDYSARVNQLGQLRQQAIARGVTPAQAQQLYLEAVKEVNALFGLGE